MIATTLINALALELGESPQDGDTVQAFLGFIQDTIREINMMGEWKHTLLQFPFETDAGEAVVSLPETVGSIVSIQRVDTGRPVEYVDLEILTEGQLILDTPGEAAFWNYFTIDGGVTQLRLYPVPDDTYSYMVDYENSNQELTSEDDTIQVPHDFIPVVKHGVRVMYYSAANEPTQVALYERRFERGIQALRGRYESIRLDRQKGQYNDIDGQTGWPTPQLPSTYPRIG